MATKTNKNLREIWLIAGATIVFVILLKFSWVNNNGMPQSSIAQEINSNKSADIKNTNTSGASKQGMGVIGSEATAAKANNYNQQNTITESIADNFSSESSEPEGVLGSSFNSGSTSGIAGNAGSSGGGSSGSSLSGGGSGGSSAGGSTGSTGSSGESSGGSSGASAGGGSSGTGSGGDASQAAGSTTEPAADKGGSGQIASDIGAVDPAANTTPDAVTPPVPDTTVPPATLPDTNTISGGSAGRSAKSLRYFQIRYDDSPVTSTEVQSGEFTIGSRVGRTPAYAYVHFDSIDGHIRMLSMTTASKRYTLSLSDLGTLFATYGTDEYGKYNTSKILIAADKIQKFEILGVHRELVASHPELFPNGKDLKYGVVQDAHWDCVLNGAGKVIPDSSVMDYQQGKTIVLPLAGADPASQFRFVLNLNSPAVREYCARLALKTMQNNDTNCLFIDNTAWSATLTLATTLKYMGTGDVNEQVIGYANALETICHTIKTRATSKSYILSNGLVPWCSEQKLFLDTFTNSTDLDGMLCENQFMNKYYSSNVEDWLKWIDKFTASNKKILFGADTSAGFTSNYNDQNVYKAWLWLNLIENGNVYMYITEHFDKTPTKYSFYQNTLGNPLEARPQKQGMTWQRKFTGGTIVFNTNSNSIELLKSP